MKAPRISLDTVIVVVAVLFIFLALYYAGDVVGLEADVFTDFLLIAPGLVLFGVGVLILVGTRKGIFALPGFTVLGIGLAVLSEEMYDLGILNDAMVSYLTIGEFQLLVIGVSFMIGAIAAGISARR